MPVPMIFATTAICGILALGLGLVLLDLQEILAANMLPAPAFAPLLATAPPCGHSRLLVTFAVVPAAHAAKPGRKGALTLEERDKNWRGSPLDMAEGGMDPYGIREVVIEFDNGDRDIFRPQQREEFGSYELHMMAAYLDSIAHSVRKGQKD